MSGAGWRRLLNLDVLANIATIGTCGVVVWVLLGSQTGPAARSAGRPEPPLPKAPLPLQGLPSLGQTDAKMVMVVFSDFECPFCKRFALETFPSIRAEYVESGKLRVVFRHFPIEQIHKHARAAAVASSCAHEQGRFWEFHDLLFAGEKLTDSAVREHSNKLQLDSKAFVGCLGSDTATKLVDADVALSRELQISSTPAFLFGMVGSDGNATIKRRLSGAQRLGEFKGILEGLSMADNQR